MGGSGSGRRRRDKVKDTTEKYLALDVRSWQRDEVLLPGITFQTTWTDNGASIGVRAAVDQVVLNYRHRMADAEWTDHEYPVRLDRTPCTYGGTRAWFICPAKDCGRRVAMLYLGPAGIFAGKKQTFVRRGERRRYVLPDWAGRPGLQSAGLAETQRDALAHVLMAHNAGEHVDVEVPYRTDPTSRHRVRADRKEIG